MAKLLEHQSVAEKTSVQSQTDIETPKGTVFITFLFLLVMAALWGYMYLVLLQQA